MCLVQRSQRSDIGEAPTAAPRSRVQHSTTAFPTKDFEKGYAYCEHIRLSKVIKDGPIFTKMDFVKSNRQAEPRNEMQSAAFKGLYRGEEIPCPTCPTFRTG